MKSAFRFLRDPLAIVGAMLRLLAGKREGNVAIIFGLAAIPVVVGAGMAMDTARAYMVKIRLGSALDGAALAIGSQSNQTQATLQTDLNNYFFNNYCKAVPAGTTVTQCSGTVSAESSISVQPITDITAATVTYQAQATVPTTFMRIVGVNSLTVSVTAQTTKFPGMEIAVVLDNTGSMLCGAAATASSGYSNCSSGAVASDTTCTNSNNLSRICTLIPAAQQFVTTLHDAITGPQSIYMSIIPYVTTVNLGNAFCPGGSCSNITTDAASGNFTDLRGNMLPVTPVTGNTTINSTTISNILPSTSAIRPGMQINGPGITIGTTVNSVNSPTSITISSSATLTYTSASLTLGSDSSISPNITSSQVQVLAISATGTVASGSKVLSSILPNTTGVIVGMIASGSGIPSGDAVASVNSSSQVTLSTNASQSGSNKALTFNLPGNVASGSTSVTTIPSTTGIVPGMLISDPTASGGSNRIPANTYVTTVNSTTQITMSANASGTTSSDILIFTSQGGTTTNASTSVAGVSLPSVPSVGMIIAGNGIPANTTITAAPSTAAQYTAGTGTLTISSAATKTNNTELNIYQPTPYASAYNSAVPTGSSTTPNWGGCVVEPTSSGENASGTGVLSVAGNPDTSEPTSGTKWYPYFWNKDTTNNWPTIQRQDTTTEIQGSLGSYDSLDGPNQGCPAPMLPLTDLTTSAGQTAINTAISNMWPRDAGGTQVHTGMIWGWRALSPNGPFAANNGHPLSYSNASAQGWKKIIVLMTDGSEEWPTSGEYTGLGALPDGKLGTTNSTSTAQNTLDTRLSTLCANLAASNTNGTPNYKVYTIGLGTDGANNSILRNNCPANGGFFSAATPSNLTSVFQQIAASIIHLRLTQ